MQASKYEVVSIDEIYWDLASILDHFWSGWKPNEDISIVEHARKNLYLVSGKNPFPGLVDFFLTPYLLEILEALMPDNGIEKIVLMKGWQTGGTLAALAWMLWVMDVSPAPMLIVQPNDELRNRFSKQRIEPIISHCRSLRGKIKEMQEYAASSKKEKSTLVTKVFPGGFLNLGKDRRHLYVQTVFSISFLMRFQHTMTIAKEKVILAELPLVARPPLKEEKNSFIFLRPKSKAIAV